MPALPASADHAGIATRGRSKSSWPGEAGPDFDRLIPPAGLEPAASGLRVRRHSPFDHGGLYVQSQHPIGDDRHRCRLCRRRQPTAGIETTHRSKSSRLGEAEPDFDRLLRRQGSNLGLAINSRASYRSTTPERKRKERESNPQGRSPPVFETGYRARWQSFRQVAPAGLEPARPRLRVGRSAELSYGARDVVGRSRTCTPRVSSGRST